MHEMSLCEGILQILQDNAKTQNYTRVHRVRVEVGQFATIEKDALHFCFEVVCRNTLAEGAALDICTAAAKLEGISFDFVSEASSSGTTSVLSAGTATD